MKKVLISSIIILSLSLVSCGNNPAALKYISDNTPVEEVAEKKETVEVKEVEKNYTLNDYINMRIWFEVTDGTNEIDKGEAIILNNLCKNNEEFKIFEKSMSPTIYELYPELSN